ncbi:hypothetical protein SMD44_05035 [Streptomyces alboflavus]|uniref:Uncharacterized protein n=1 Tax=Streptomyces alboflavus TaxID=67267 RepID=A0A1Z1WGK4_9ACTN|nr:hypothetical protein SMD44_05035 [Streptomyces alboflavus]
MGQGRGGGAGGGVLGEAGRHQVAEVAGEGAEFGLLVDDLVEQGGGGVAGEGGARGGRVDEDRAEGEDVGGAGDALAEDLLGDM